ncbi:rna polymerase ii c-terminal domain phosphatase-like 4 [Quercus suber]|uniref:protein-serine/threonine phosphatase n=1 Tax=Quercus suber TaxID=58331 RepID=A0AAW0J6A9_QUESU
MAEELGAKFSMDNLIHPITHVVTWFATAEKFREAELEGIILVHPKWLRACYHAVSRTKKFRTKKFRKLPRFTMKIISERGFPQDDYDDFDDTPEENTEKTYLHPCVFRGKCVSCETVALKYVHQGMWLWLSKDEMDRIRKVESAKLLQDKKIVLVLDLDQTLVHSTEQEKYLKTPQELLQHELRDSLFRLESTLGKDDAQVETFRSHFSERSKYHV